MAYQAALNDESATADLVSVVRSEPARASHSFWAQLAAELLGSCYRHEADNIDRLRFNQSPAPKAAIRNTILHVAAWCGFYRTPNPARDILEISELERGHGLLEDQFSKDLLVKLLAYRVLGSRHVRLPLNNPHYWEQRRSLSQFVEKKSTITDVPVLGPLDLCRINNVRLHTHPLVLLNTFILEQYRSARADVGVRPGDVVIDAGGCWGDTALYFAESADQVYCFECMPSNIAIAQQNLNLNPTLSRKIRVIGKALWSQSGEALQFGDFGPGSRPGNDSDAVSVMTQTLDDFVSENSIKKVDFIKMDIEGAEPEALAGAERTIRKHRPRLAISVYHDPRHFASIPCWLAGLNVGYRFWLDHFTIHQEETILFARSES